MCWPKEDQPDSRTFGALAVSLLDLPPELFEAWQERVCIMHYDGRLPLQQAAAAALADVFPASLLRDRKSAPCRAA
jgi:hypothetical protein